MWWKIAPRRWRNSQWLASMTSMHPQRYVLTNLPGTIFGDGGRFWCWCWCCCCWWWLWWGCRAIGAYCCTSSWRESGARAMPSLCEYASGEMSVNGRRSIVGVIGVPPPPPGPPPIPAPAPIPAPDELVDGGRMLSTGGRTAPLPGLPPIPVPPCPCPPPPPPPPPRQRRRRRALALQLGLLLVLALAELASAVVPGHPRPHAQFRRRHAPSRG